MNPVLLETTLDSLSKVQAEAVLFKVQQIHATLVSPQPANGYFILGTFAERLAGVVRSYPCDEQPQDPESPVEPVQE